MFYYTYFLPFFVLISFFSDVTIFAFFEEPTINAILIFYVWSLLSSCPATYSLLALVGLSAESLLFYDSASPLLLFLAPVTIVILLIKETVHITRWLSLVILASVLALQWFVLNPCILNGTHCWQYTILKIIANIFLAMIFY